MHSRQQLTADLRSLGIAPGDVVMAHASVRAVGEVAGGPDEIHLALKEALTGEGTLVMYAGCPRCVDEVGRGNLSPLEEAEVLEKLPLLAYGFQSRKNTAKNQRQSSRNQKVDGTKKPKR